MTGGRLRDWLTAALLAGALAVVLVWLPGEELRGRAMAVDGNSLRLDGREIRLFGIDAPEARQTCRRANGRTWPCGRRAKALLDRLARAGSLVCEGRDEDQYGRLVATCRSAGSDLGEEMVRHGLALAYRSHSHAYADIENGARAAGRGMWSGRFEKPRQWRVRHRGGATSR